MRAGIFIAALSALALLVQPAEARPARSTEPDDDISRMYMTLRGFTTSTTDSDTTVEKFQYERNGGFSAALGYDPDGSHPIWGNSRFELEGMHYQSPIKHSARAAGIVPVDGDLSTSAIMFNVMYPMMFKGNWKPYIGAGIGFAQVDLDYQIPGAARVEESGGLFAWQLRAGLQYQVQSIPELQYLIGYRYFTTEPLQVGAQDVDNQVHSLEVGMTVNF